MEQTVNTFQDGLVTDYNPLLSPDTMLTDALNATLVTMNGNERILQNDMGNARVETAFLPSGYVPVGIKEHGGIIYVASHNPLTGKSQIGSFPSPERNINQEEDTNLQDFISITDRCDSGEQLLYQKMELYGGRVFHPGDKFLIYHNSSEDDPEFNKKYITNWNNVFNENPLCPQKRRITYKVMAEDSSHNLIDITNQLKRFDENGEEIEFEDNVNTLLKFNSGYFIPNIEEKQEEASSSSESAFIGERKKFKNLNIYKNKWSGKLFLVKEYNVIDHIGLNIASNIEQNEQQEEILTISFYITYYYNCPDGFVQFIDEVIEDGNEENGQETEADEEIQEESGDSTSFTKYSDISPFITNLDNFPYYDKETNLYSYQLKFDVKIKKQNNVDSWEFLDKNNNFQTEVSIRNSSDRDFVPYKQLFPEEYDKVIKGCKYDLSISENKLNYKFIPVMEFGKDCNINLNNLSQSGTIDINKINSNTIELNTWKWLYTEGCVNLCYSFTPYPAYGSRLEYLKFVFVPITKIKEESGEYPLLSTDVGVPINNYDYNDIAASIENINNTSDKIRLQLNSENNSIYMCYIYYKFDTIEEKLYDAKWVIQTPIYNDLFDDNHSDFCSINDMDIIKTHNMLNFIPDITINYAPGQQRECTFYNYINNEWEIADNTEYVESKMAKIDLNINLNDYNNEKAILDNDSKYPKEVVNHFSEDNNKPKITINTDGESDKIYIYSKFKVEKITSDGNSLIEIKGQYKQGKTLLQSWIGKKENINYNYFTLYTDQNTGGDIHSLLQCYKNFNLNEVNNNYTSLRKVETDGHEKNKIYAVLRVSKDNNLKDWHNPTWFTYPSFLCLDAGNNDNNVLTSESYGETPCRGKVLPFIVGTGTNHSLHVANQALKLELKSYKYIEPQLFNNDVFKKLTPKNDIYFRVIGSKIGKTTNDSQMNGNIYQYGDIYTNNIKYEISSVEMTFPVYGEERSSRLTFKSNNLYSNYNIQNLIPEDIKAIVESFYDNSTIKPNISESTIKYEIFDSDDKFCGYIDDNKLNFSNNDILFDSGKYYHKYICIDNVNKYLVFDDSSNEETLDKASRLIENHILQNRNGGDGRWCMNSNLDNDNYLIPKTFDITTLYDGFKNYTTNHIYFYNLFQNGHYTPSTSGKLNELKENLEQQFEGYNLDQNDDVNGLFNFILNQYIESNLDLIQGYTKKEEIEIDIVKILEQYVNTLVEESVRENIKDNVSNILRYKYNEDKDFYTYLATSINSTDESYVIAEKTQEIGSPYLITLFKDNE